MASPSGTCWLPSWQDHAAGHAGHASWSAGKAVQQGHTASVQRPHSRAMQHLQLVSVAQGHMGRHPHTIAVRPSLWGCQLPRMVMRQLPAGPSPNRAPLLASTAPARVVVGIALRVHPPCGVWCLWGGGKPLKPRLWACCTRSPAVRAACVRTGRCTSNQVHQQTGAPANRCTSSQVHPCNPTAKPPT